MINEVDAPSLEQLGLTENPRHTAKISPVREHVRASIEHQLRAIIRHDPGTRSGHDPEELHQTRAAVRRLRAVLGSARRALDPEWTAALRAELGWLDRKSVV